MKAFASCAAATVDMCLTLPDVSDAANVLDGTCARHSGPDSKMCSSSTYSKQYVSSSTMHVCH